MFLNLCLPFFYLDISFWKSTARKVFVVSKTSFDQASNNSTSGGTKSQIENAIREVDRKIENALIVTRTANLESAIWSTKLITPLQQLMKCLICQDTCSSPIYIGNCCKQILGCKGCVDGWRESYCPHCRSDDYEKLEMPVFEEILGILRLAS